MTTKRISPTLSRRRFLASSAATSAFSFTIVPSYVLGGPGRTPPSERVNFAGIGAGGQAAVTLTRQLRWVPMW